MHISKSVTCDAFISILTIENGVGIHCGTKDVVTQGSTYDDGENVVGLRELSRRFAEYEENR